MVIGDDLLDLPSAGRELHVSVRKLYRMVRAGEIAMIKHGQRSFVERQEIEAYWARRRAEALKARATRAKQQAIATKRTRQTTTPAEDRNGDATSASAARRPAA